MSRSGFATFLLGSAVLALPFAAAAQDFDFTPYNSRILSDPAFLPVAGQFYGVTSYNYTDSHGTGYNDAANTKIYALHNWSDAFGQSLSYGITDDLSVGANIAYDPFAEDKRTFVGGGESVAKSSGWADPSFNVTWRALDQAVQPVNLDLFGSYSPDWMSAHASTNAEDGTIARGGQAGTVGAAISRVTRSFTLYGSVAADFIDTTKLNNPVIGASIDTGSRTDYTLALDSQTRFNDVLSLNAGVSHVWNNNASVFNTASDVFHLNEPGDNTTVRVALNYHVVPNTLVASLTYGHEFPDNTRNIFPAADVASDNSLRNRDANLYGAKLSYVFP